MVPSLTLDLEHPVFTLNDSSQGVLHSLHFKMKQNMMLKEHVGGKLCSMHNYAVVQKAPSHASDDS